MRWLIVNLSLVPGAPSDALVDLIKTYASPAHTWHALHALAPDLIQWQKLELPDIHHQHLLGEIFEQRINQNMAWVRVQFDGLQKKNNFPRSQHLLRFQRL